jgi:DNA polymerase III delta prime subunit
VKKLFTKMQDDFDAEYEILDQMDSPKTFDLLSGHLSANSIFKHRSVNLQSSPRLVSSPIQSSIDAQSIPWDLHATTLHSAVESSLHSAVESSLFNGFAQGKMTGSVSATTTSGLQFDFYSIKVDLENLRYSSSTRIELMIQQIKEDNEYQAKLELNNKRLMDSENDCQAGNSKKMLEMESDFDFNSKSIPTSIDAKKLMNDSKRLLEKSSENDSKRLKTLDNNGQSKKAKMLWVEKYKPRRFADLVGNDLLNRSVLSWVHQFTKSNNVNSIDFKKLLLISGPPGCGKSSLAEIVGMHFNYNIIHLNASSDRNLATFKDLLLPAVLNSYSKPNMVIIDEIDGISSFFIENLIKLVQNKYRIGRKIVVLRRPIICICNDLGAPVLKNLKNVAQVVKYGGSKSAMVMRLKAICGYQGLNLKLDALEQLVDACGCDLRACINKLQFDAQTSYDGKLVSRVQRDVVLPWYSVMDLVFTGKSTAQELAELMESRLGSNEFTTIINAAFHHYLNTTRFDTTFKSKVSNTVVACDYLVFGDIMGQQVAEYQRFGLESYRAWILGVFRRFSTMRAGPFAFPQAFVQMQKYESEIQLLKQKFVNDMGKSGFYWKHYIITELAPLFQLMLTPKLSNVFLG